MTWFLIALIAQFILGTSAVFDKKLLVSSLPSPVSYTFWLGIIGIFAVVLIPFGFELVSLQIIALAFLAGVVFILAMFAFYGAMFFGEASVSVISIRGFSPIATFFFGAMLIGSRLEGFQIAGFILLVVGALLLSVLTERHMRFRVFLFVLASALLFGLSNILAKLVFNETSFITGFVLMKIGGVFFALLFLLYGPWRKRIVHPARQNEFTNKWLYFGNRAYAGAGSLFVFYAISLGPPSLVEAMQSAQFLFIFLGGWVLLRERFRGRILVGKLAALVLISLGVAVLGIGEYIKSTIPDSDRPITWGVTFSEKFSRKFDFNQLGRPVSKLGWQDNYDAILDDLGARHLRLIAYWDILEPEEDQYDFSGLDYQMRRAEEVGAEVILVVGKKVPRWPECHDPDWVQNEEKTIKNEKLFEYVEVVVHRYKDSSALQYWQVENEPFLSFGEGECALSGRELLDTEVELVRRLDPETPIIITDSGEIGRWVRSAKRGDVFGTTMYRRVHNDQLGNFEYPIGPGFFRIKEKIVRTIIQDYHKKFLVIELGMEPWLKRQPYETTPEEQFRVFDFAFFQDSVQFAKDTGFDEYYLWGVEWWYWMKEKHGDDRFWEEAKQLF